MTLSISQNLYPVAFMGMTHHGNCMRRNNNTQKKRNRLKINNKCFQKKCQAIK